jgi:uncharacterized protein (DUF2147 family)
MAYRSLKRPIRGLAVALAASPILASATVNVHAQSAAAELGIWINHTGKGAIETYLCGSNLCGRIVWLKEPNTSAGKPKHDAYNPDPAKRKRLVCGLTTLAGLKRLQGGGWGDGQAYNPEEGKQYSVSVRLADSDTLKVTGSVLFFSKTVTWKRAKGQIERCDKVAAPTIAAPQPAPATAPAIPAAVKTPAPEAAPQPEKPVPSAPEPSRPALKNDATAAPAAAASGEPKSEPKKAASATPAPASIKPAAAPPAPAPAPAPKIVTPVAQPSVPKAATSAAVPNVTVIKPTPKPVLAAPPKPATPAGANAATSGQAAAPAAATTAKPNVKTVPGAGKVTPAAAAGTASAGTTPNSAANTADAPATVPAAKTTSAPPKPAKRATESYSGPVIQ